MDVDRSCCASAVCLRVARGHWMRSSHSIEWRTRPSSTSRDDNDSLLIVVGTVGYDSSG
jgi:hypothetical protein